MGAGQSADIPGGGSEGYHVLRVISRSIYFAPLFYTAVVEKLIYHGELTLHFQKVSLVVYWTISFMCYVLGSRKFTWIQGWVRAFL